MESDYWYCLLVVFEKYKDLYYFICFPHFNIWITILLGISIIIPCILTTSTFLPFKVFAGHNKINPCYKTESLMKRFLSINFQYFGLNHKIKNKIRRQFYLFTFFACTQNLIQMCCKLYDCLLMGNTITAYLGFFIFCDFISFNYRFGQMVGINGQLQQEKPLRRIFLCFGAEVNDAEYEYAFNYDDDF